MFAERRQNFVDKIFETGESIFAGCRPEAVRFFAPQIFRQVSENLFVDFVESVKFWCWPTIVASFWWWLTVLFVEIKFAADWFVAVFCIH